MIVVLDSSPVGILTSPLANPEANRCHEWLATLISNGHRVFTSEICDYEVRRELLRLGNMASIARLDAFILLVEFMPINRGRCFEQRSSGRRHAGVGGQRPSLPSFIERAREKHGRAWARWTSDEDARLTTLFKQEESRAEIERQLGRQPGAIRNRLLKLGLISEQEAGIPQEATVPQDEGIPQEANAPGMPHEVHPWVPGAVDAGDHAEPSTGRAPSQPIVPGWEALRDRLTPNRETP
jgi:hypothetical protein